MPYLSRIWLNPLRRGAQRLLTDPHVVHAAVLGSLPQQPVQERTLWRLEPEAHRAALLVLTHSRPSWEHVVEQAGWPGSDDPQALVSDYAPLLARIVTGREFAFRLRANTVSSTKTPAAPRHVSGSGSLRSDPEGSSSPSARPPTSWTGSPSGSPGGASPSWRSRAWRS